MDIFLASDRDYVRFSQECVELLRRHIGLGARGLKIVVVQRLPEGS